VNIVGYADDWAIYNSDQDMKTAQTNIQSALNNIPKWRRRKGFAGKNDSHAHIQAKTTTRKSD
jgi:hypothetical protein